MVLVVVLRQTELLEDLVVERRGGGMRNGVAEQIKLVP